MKDKANQHWKKIVGVGAAIATAAGVYFATTSNNLWNGDLSTGNFSQYKINQQTSTLGAATVGSAATITLFRGAGIPGGFANASDFRTLRTCVPGTGGRCRAELGIDANTTGSKNLGSWTKPDWYVMFPKTGNGCQPSFWTLRQLWGGGPSFSVVSLNGVRTMELKLFKGNLTNLPNANQGLTKTIVKDIPIVWNHWYHMQEQIKWGTSPTTGAYELKVDGTAVVPMTTTQTRPASSPPYWKMGTYTHAGCDTEVLFAGVHFA
jgi:hypothetical protein